MIVLGEERMAGRRSWLVVGRRVPVDNRLQSSVAAASGRSRSYFLIASAQLGRG